MSRTQLKTGTFPSSKLDELPLSRPFTRQGCLDIVFPSSNLLQNVLTGFKTGYVRTKSKIAAFVEVARSHINPLTFESDITAFAYNSPETDETWCIDTRGVLTLSVGKETYQSLGLIGSKLPWKQTEGQYIIVLSENIPAERSKNTKLWNPLGPKQKIALELYDKLRQDAGLDSWEVQYHCTKPSVLSPEHEIIQVLPEVVELHDVHIPMPNLSPQTGGDESETEDWNEHISELYEWVGMSCLGAQRLQLNDRVDPYVAVYTPPEPSRNGSATHIRWRGLLHPTFTQEVSKAAWEHIAGLPAQTPLFVAMTLDSFAASPVVYVPPSSSDHSTPLRFPRDDAQDTLSIIFTGTQTVDGKVNWCSVECIGQCDTRWG